MGKSAIPYCDKSWNVVTGCTPCSPGCGDDTGGGCWAKAVHDMRHKAVLAGKKLAPQYREPFSKVQLLRDRLDEPLHWKKSNRVFVGSTGDLFHKDVPDDYIAAVFGVMAATPHHLHLTLTKRPERMLEWCSDLYRPGALNDAVIERGLLGFGHGLPTDLLRWPLPNVLLGATVCNQAEADRIVPVMARLAAQGWRTWLSVEPMLGPVKLGLMGTCPKSWGLGYRRVGEGLEWVAIGGESAPRNRMRLMDPEWGAALLRECRAAGTRVFMKQLHVPERVGGRPRLVTEPRYFPTGLAVRDLPDMPEVRP